MRKERVFWRRGLPAMLAVVAVGLAAGLATGEEIKGKVKSVVKKTKTVSVNVKDKGTVVLSVDDATQFVNARSLRQLDDGDLIRVVFTPTGAGNRATTIERVVPKLPAGVAELTTDELNELIEGGQTFTLIDARPTSRYDVGHIPGAVSLPFPKLEKADAEGTVESLLGADKGALIVFYCGGITWVLSPKSAGLAAKNGYTQVKVNRAGDPGWKEAEYPLEASLDFVKNGNLVLVDLRAPEAVQAGHLPRAVNLSPDALEGMEASFPPDKSAPIVFYSDDQQAVLDALEYMVDWGYPNASRVNNALAAWQARGWELATGPAGKAIAYVRKLGPNEVSAQEFLDAVEKGAAVIVDARSKDEFEGGHFKGALNLPAEESASRFAEVPTDRPVLLYCSSGSRAEMLFDVLHEKGYKDVKYLVAHVEIDAAGKGTVAQ